MQKKRVTILTGHYGSGKTSIAVNLAMRLAAEGKPVTICDLDIVIPYFRTADHRARLTERGVALISSQFAGSNVDLPALPAELYAAIEDRSAYAVLDVGGDDRGAVALGRYAPSILAAGDYGMLFVTNFFRPLTKTPEAALAVLREIETACGIPAAGLINNSNLGRATAARDLLDTAARMETLSKLAGLPVRATAADGRLCDELAGKIENLFCMDLTGTEPIKEG